MTEAVEWHKGGQPFSARFGDVYHSESGAEAQARHVFLGGCGLPGAWADAPQWRILETGFGLGLNFLTAWRAWRDDPRRPGRLHFVSVEAYPVAAADIERAAAAQGPAIGALGRELAAQWHGLLPGCHRLAFDDGRVLLTLGIGDARPMLRGLARFEADSLFLDGFSPQKNPEMWSPELLRTLARFARRGTRIATWSVARGVRDALAPLGFVLEMAPGLPPKRDCLRGEFAPAWPLRARGPEPERVDARGRCVVVGAGLAGAAVAASLARRGWQVAVLEAAPHAAAGASGAPAGVFAPHVSPDDALLSRLTRAGVRATLSELRRIGGAEGDGWAAPGVLERRAPHALRLPPGWTAEGPNESWPATPAQAAHAGLAADTAALWHAHAGWASPARLVESWLATPGITLCTGSAVTRVAPLPDGRWAALDADGRPLADGDRVVLAAGAATRALAGALPLQPVRGQLAWGTWPADAEPPSCVPVNGDGHCIPAVSAHSQPLRWLSGATYAPGDDGTDLRDADTQANLDRLAGLHPGLAVAVRGSGVQAWAGVRCASHDRRPLVGPVPGAPDAGLWACTALGSRGLSFAALCAELLAARWHGEPLPVSAALARGLDTARLRA